MKQKKKKNETNAPKKRVEEMLCERIHATRIIVAVNKNGLQHLQTLRKVQNMPAICLVYTKELRVYT